METKIATSVNQSKTLIELGIDVNTADMYWEHDSFLGYYRLELFEDGFPKTLNKDDIPAWSLSALMGLMPYPSLHNFFNNKWRCDIHYEDGDVRKFGEDADSPIDAAFEMVCYLLENKLI